MIATPAPPARADLIMDPSCRDTPTRAATSTAAELLALHGEGAEGAAVQVKPATATELLQAVALEHGGELVGLEEPVPDLCVVRQPILKRVCGGNPCILHG